MARFQCTRCPKEGDNINEFVWGSKEIVCVECSDAEQQEKERKHLERLRQTLLERAEQEKLRVPPEEGPSIAEKGKGGTTAPDVDYDTGKEAAPKPVKEPKHASPENLS